MGGIMTELLTSAQMRAVEASAIASGAVSGAELMERAGRGVVAAIVAQWPQMAAPPGALPRTPGYLSTDEGQAPRVRRAVLLCGPGNNGGDGFVIARLLAQMGWAVEVYLYGAPVRMPPDARGAHERWMAMGSVRPLGDVAKALAHEPAHQADLVIDALFGTGLSRPLPEDVVRVLSDLRQGRGGRPARWVSVDVVSGFCADSGRWLSGAAEGADPAPCHADLVVSFHRLKLGHVLAQGPVCSGKVVVCDIGLSSSAPQEAVRSVVPEVGRLAKGGALAGQGHKYSHGHAFVLSGPAGRGGAARLAARGALRVGAGVVTIGCAPGALPEHAARLDAVMLCEVGDDAAFAAVLEDRRINALCLGPALGITDDAGARVAQGLRDGGRGVVVDADALTLLARDATLFAALHRGCVLTPHAGEFARLFPDLAARLAAPASCGPAWSKVDATRAGAARAGCVVVFKGADTVIAGPDGRCAVHAAVHDRAAPWLATAGSGDVLAGVICGLLARGFAPFEAACTGVWLHVEAARSFGPGLIAEDLPEALPKVFRALGL